MSKWSPRRPLGARAVGEAVAERNVGRGEGRRGDQSMKPGRCPGLRKSGLVAPSPSRASLAERIIQAGVAAVLAAALGLGLVLTPSPTGTGTHQALGLPPCGMLVMTGHPCPTCGVTTSFVLAAHGRFSEALVNQPFGLVLFLAVAAGLLATLATVATGRTWAPLARVSVVTTAAILMVVLVLASWVYKWATL